MFIKMLFVGRYFGKNVFFFTLNLTHSVAEGRLDHFRLSGLYKLVTSGVQELPGVQFYRRPIF